eukprot:1452304-Pleurochrysis_carterae.AAC.3
MDSAVLHDAVCACTHVCVHACAYVRARLPARARSSAHMRPFALARARAHARMYVLESVCVHARAHVLMRSPEGAKALGRLHASALVACTLYAHSTHAQARTSLVRPAFPRLLALSLALAPANSVPPLSLPSPSAQARGLSCTGGLLSLLGVALLTLFAAVTFGGTFGERRWVTEWLLSCEMPSYYAACELRGALASMGAPATLYCFHPHGILAVGFVVNGCWSPHFDKLVNAKQGHDTVFLIARNLREWGFLFKARAPKRNEWK